MAQVIDTLAPGAALAGDYDIIRLLGSGGFGNTYLAVDRTLDREVAIKEFFPRDIAFREDQVTVRIQSPKFEDSFRWGLDRFVQEAKLLAKFRHPNIVRVFRTFDANCTSYIVLDFVRGPNVETWLHQLGRRPTQLEMDELLTPLTDALALLHDAKVLHRDIKPANICIREEAGDPVLLDFGASKYSLSEMTGTTAAIVSCGYSPYEAYAAHSKQQGAWTDIYGLGATVYRALGNGPPPEATARVLNDSMVPLHSQRLPGFRPEFLAAVDWALSVQPRNRPQSVAEWQPRLLAGSSNTAALGRQARPVLVTGTDARAPSLEAAAGRAPRRRATALGLAALLLLGGGAGLALGIGWIPSTLAPWLGEDASYRQRAVEEARPQAALARASAEAEDHKARDAEHRRIAAIRAEQDDKARDAERQRLASLKAEEDRKARDAERQRLTAAPKTAEPNKPTTDPRSRASRCAPQARITWKRTNGWGALAVGATNCGFSWGLRNKVVAEWRALDWCRRKSTDCKIVEYNQ